MLIAKFPTSALIASIALTVLAGCAGNSQMAPTPLAQSGTWSPPIQTPAFQNGRLSDFLAMRSGIVPSHRVTTPSFMDRRALSKPLVFLSDSQATVDIYLQAGTNKMVGQITGFQFAGDLATDAAGDLYVVDSSTFDIMVYAPPYTNGPKLTLPAGRYPIGVAVSRRGTVAVTTCTIPSGSQCGQGVLFYAAGSTTPCATVLTQGSLSYSLSYAAFDDKENLYIDGVNSSHNAVFGRIQGGCSAKTAKPLTINNMIAGPGSVKVDKADRIAIADGSKQNMAVIDTYDPPKGGSLGSPVSTTSLTVSGYANLFTFRASGRGLWMAYQLASGSETTSEYAYPAGGAPEKSVIGTANSYPGGVAVTPPLVR